MAIHFISILGTNLYEPVKYGDDTEKEVFVQVALIKRFREELKQGGRITIFLTEDARQRNWKDRSYDDYERDKIAKWGLDRQNKTGLRSYLQRDFPELYVEDKPIPSGRSQEEIMEIFQTIYENINDGDEIIFDITHSFRSLPMLALTVINYLGVMKNVKLKGIYYGAFEARNNSEDTAPLFDLTVYNEILQWCFAAKQFMEYGNAKMMKDVYEALPDERKTERLKEAVDSLSNLSDTIRTNRGKSKGGADNKEGYKQSIKLAVEKVQKLDEDGLNTVDNEPLKELLKKVSERYKDLAQNHNYQVGLKTVKYCIDYEMIPQGCTALEETIKSFLCFQYGLDGDEKKNREDKVNLIIGTAIAFCNDKLKGEKKRLEDLKIDNERTDLLKFFQTENETSRAKYVQLESPEETDEMDEMIRTVSIELCLISKDVKKMRNDINHFGFRPNPLTAQNFEDNLKTYYERTINEIERIEKNLGSNGVT